MKLDKVIQYVMVLSLALMSVSVIAKDNNSHQRPFWGSFDGETTFPMTGACLELTGVPFETLSQSTGKMTHMGRADLFTSHCAAPDGALGGHAVFTAANGNEVWAEYSAITVQGPPATALIGQEITMEITGGTGRFEGATGSLEGMVYIEFLGFDEPSWPLSFVLTGWIVY